MSGRHGYLDHDDIDQLQLGRWRGMVKSAIRGKRGQALLRDLRDALDAMPEKRLESGTLATRDGDVCSLGAACLHRKVMTREEMLSYLDEDGSIDDTDWVNAHLSERLDVATCLIQEIEYKNDEGPCKETPEQRWERMRRWCEKNINSQPTEVPHD